MREGGEENEEEMFVDSVESIQRVDFNALKVGDVENFEFFHLEVAYEF